MSIPGVGAVALAGRQTVHAFTVRLLALAILAASAGITPTAYVRHPASSPEKAVNRSNTQNSLGLTSRHFLSCLQADYPSTILITQYDSADAFDDSDCADALLQIRRFRGLTIPQIPQIDN